MAEMLLVEFRLFEGSRCVVVRIDLLSEVLVKTAEGVCSDKVWHKTNQVYSLSETTMLASYLLHGWGVVVEALKPWVEEDMEFDVGQGRLVRDRPRHEGDEETTGTVPHQGYSRWINAELVSVAQEPFRGCQSVVECSWEHVFRC